MADSRVRLAPIGVRLILAMVAIALAAIALLGGLTLGGARGDVSQFAREEQAHVASAAAQAVADAYRAAGTWSATDLEVAVGLAGEAQATLTVVDAAGHAVPAPPDVTRTRPTVLTGPVRSAPVVVDGTRVGTSIVHFYRAALPQADAQLRDALLRTVLAGAGLAALLALLVAAVISRSITRPLTTLAGAVRSMASGDRAVRVGAVRGAGEVVDLAGAFDRMADTIAREDELRRAVMADVAHELRTPLSILRAETETLADGVVAPDPARLASLHEEVLRLGRVVDDLDTLASAEAAALGITVRPVDLAKLASSCCATLQRSFEEAGIELRTRTAPAATEVDPFRVVQIVTNLLTNARKFTDRGGIVEVKTGVDSRGAWVEVADSGRGIEPDELPHVFERFWRGRDSGRLAGSGVGLAVVKSLVDAHGGEVTITSEATEGTRVRVTFPRHGAAPVDGCAPG